MIKHFYPEVNENNVDDYIRNGRLEKVDSLFNKYQEIKKEYEEFLNSLKTHQEYVDECESNREKLQWKYISKFIEEFRSYLSELEIDDYYNLGYQHDTLKLLIGSDRDVSEMSIIEMFSKRSDEVLNSNESDYQKNIIKVLALT